MLIIISALLLAIGLLALAVPASEGNEAARLIFSVELVVVFFAALFLCLIALVFAWAGCLDYCKHEHGFWSIPRAGRLGVGILAAAFAAYGMKLASSDRVGTATASGLVAIAAASAVAISL